MLSSLPPFVLFFVGAVAVAFTKGSVRKVLVLAIPVIGGACLLEIVSLLRQATFTTPPSFLALGALISFGVGLASLVWLIRLLERGKLHYFAAWCIPLGIVVIIWQLLWT